MYKFQKLLIEGFKERDHLLHRSIDGNNIRMNLTIREIG
jgi:hypothetical protein